MSHKNHTGPVELSITLLSHISGGCDDECPKTLPHPTLFLHSLPHPRPDLTSIPEIDTTNPL